MPKTLWSAMRGGKSNATRKWAEAAVHLYWGVAAEASLSPDELHETRLWLKPASSRTASRSPNKSGAQSSAGIPAQPGVGHAAVAAAILVWWLVPHQSQMDLPARLVASMSPSRTAGGGCAAMLHVLKGHGFKPCRDACLLERAWLQPCRKHARKNAGFSP